jgi:UDP-N-acetylglucosamine/UDP-N-acetylgalactosamine diphosphorylase
MEIPINKNDQRGKQALGFDEALEKLKPIGQEHLLKYWDKLNPSEQESLCTQIDELDIQALIKKEVLADKAIDSVQKIESVRDYAVAGNKQNADLGRELIEQGNVGCLIVAGGQGTRLRYDGPKGMFPVSVFKHKTLFQIFAEKVAAASKQCGCLLPLAIMTSPLNHAESLSFFEDNHFFGLKPEQIYFFVQGTLPFLDVNGNLFLEEPGLIAQGPDGNGSSLKRFVEVGIWKKWQKLGVKYLNYVLIDNPLADPFDAELVGYHRSKGSEATIKSTFRRDTNEKVGLLVLIDGKIHVAEYSELAETERVGVDSLGTLRHQCANLSLFCFDMEFVQKMSGESYKRMPWHTAFKAVKYLDKEGVTRFSNQPIAWKFEKYIFDVLPFSDKVRTLVYPRERCFSPLKNYSGEDSIATVQRALQRLDEITIENITGIEPPFRPFELSQEFYYPTQQLLKKWKGKTLPNENYIEG